MKPFEIWNEVKVGDVLHYACLSNPNSTKPEILLSSVEVVEVTAKAVRFKRSARATGFREHLPRRDCPDWRGLVFTAEQAKSDLAERYRLAYESASSMAVARNNQWLMVASLVEDA